MAVYLVAEQIPADPAGPVVLAASLGGWWLLVALLLAAAAVAAWRFRDALISREEDDPEADDVPLLVFPVQAPSGGVARWRGPEQRQRPRGAGGGGVGRAHGAATPPAAVATPAVPRMPPAPLRGDGDGDPPLLDGTLQLLPGRLEVVDGLAQRADIRFVKVPGREAVVTLGRGSGSAPSHVQLAAPTVSGEHARLQLADGAWYITNLSRTNPVVVNDAEVSSNGTGRGQLLRDGDRIELGEVVLMFRSR
jgi:hypothetical protein